MEKREFWLVLKAQSGDRDSLDELFKLIQEPIYYYICSLVGDSSLSEDVLQEVFITIYRKLYWLREPKLFRPWVYRIASRLAFKHLKREKEWNEQIRDEAIMEEIVQPETTVEFQPEIQARLPELIKNISAASRAVIVLHYLHEMTLEEVADVLGINIGTVKSRLSYGLSILRKSIQT
ncbi:MAG: RNA polymerase sigma factor [Blastocatellia bacterium]|nr:RNA polymerase sigma factor [Blastocatellia bacterium]